MIESLFSPYWYRAAALHPRLIATVRVTRQVFRGEPWYVLSEPGTARQFRVNALGYALVGRLDGRRSVQEIWDLLVRELGADAPSQHEVLGMLSELIGAGMLHSEQAPDLAGIFEHSRRKRARGDRRLNPLAFRVPLFNPARLLDALLPLARPLFRGWVFALGLLATALAGLLALLHGSALHAYAGQHLGSPANLLMIWLAYPFIKVLHELAHALAIRVWGGQVNEMGLTLFLLMPVPYVDGSAASAFAEKHRRVLVSALGVLVELGIAALALFLWLAVEDGLLREACFAVMSLGFASSLLVNANPLMRFDGYYVLTDLIEAPGLAARADAWLRYLGERWLLGNRHLTPPPGTERYRALLLTYGLASLIYRIVLLGGMALWLAAKQFILGLALGLWLLVQFLLRPLWRLLRHVSAAPRLAPVRTRAWAGTLGLGALLGAAFLVWPAPCATQTTALVWVPEDATVRNEAEGFVSEVLLENGAELEAGQLILRLDNPELRANQARLSARLASRLTAQQAALLEQPATALALSEEIASLRTQLDEIASRLAALEIRAPVAGRLGLPGAHDLPGRFVPRGTTLAQVIAPRGLSLRAALRQQDIELLHEPDIQLVVRTAEDRGRSLHARLSHQEPGAGWKLPSPLLGDTGGGDVRTDPADRDGLRTLEPVFLIDLEVPGEAQQRIGTRAWLRMEQARTPLATQAWRALQQLFVRQFSRGALAS